MRSACVAVLWALAWTATTSAQTPERRFHWQQGQTLNYQVEHTTGVSEVVGGNKSETKSKINLVRRWQVVAVDAQGIATLEMSITAMRNELTRPGGEVLLFDSRDPEKSTPALREQLSKYIGQTVAVLRVDGLGRVVEVVKGPGNRYDSEPPFGLVLPASVAAVGQAWERPFTLVLDPPLGTGEKHDGVQKYVCAKVEGGLASFSLATLVAKMPESKMEQLPLLQKLPEGEVVFDVQRGRLHSLRLVIDRQIENHQGEGSSYQFQSSYTERVAE